MEELSNTISNIEHSSKPYISTWSNIFSCRPSYLFIPKNENEIRSLFEWCHENGQKIRIVGGLCMENNLWCPDTKHEERHTVIISCSKFNKILNVSF